MRETRVFHPTKINEDKRSQIMSPERIAELYPEDYKSCENSKFWDFVEWMRSKGKSRFGVSRKDEKYADDPDLMFFEIGQVTTGEYPDIIFLGKQMGKGSIEITNRFAAETHGYYILQLEPRKDEDRTRHQFYYQPAL